MIKIIIKVLTIVFLSSAVHAEPDFMDLEEQTHCLASAIYFESRNQPVIGQIAVGLVAINRMMDSRFPNTVCEVVKQADRDDQGRIVRHQCQFSYYCDGLKETIREERAWITAKTIAAVVMTEEHPDITGGALFYHSDQVEPYWSSVFEVTVQIGNHIFYRR